MRILLINKFYYPRGGDCIYTLSLEGLLRAKGHEVAVMAMDYPSNLTSQWTRYFPSNMTAVKALRRPLGDGETRSKMRALLRDFQPEVVHLNNIHTQLSPLVGEMAKEAGCKVVWTLHDYKLLCPRYDCLKGGKEICEECFAGDKSGCLKYRCMKGSLPASLIGWAEARKWHRQRLEKMTDLFICPSQFMANKMAQGGFDRKKLRVLCNFIDTRKCQRADGYAKEDYYCYVGRLSHEKGVRTLIEAANRLPHPLVIVGAGPLEQELKSIAKGHIRFAGYQQWDQLKETVGRARFTVIPSEWYENNPLSVLEAQCLGTPVLGARIGGIPELIEPGFNGQTFESRNVDDLAQRIREMWPATFPYASIAQQAADNYNAEKYYRRLSEKLKVKSEKREAK